MKIGVLWDFIFGRLQCSVIPIVRACSPTSRRLQLQLLVVYEVQKSVLNVCSLFLESITLSDCLPLEAVVLKCLIHYLTPTDHGYPKGAGLFLD